MTNLEPGERIYLLKRRHQIVLILQILFGLILCGVIFFLILFFSFYKISWPQILIENYPNILNYKANFILAFLLSLILPILWISIFFTITQYYLTYWVVTNQRILEAKLVSFFNIQYSSIELDKIQDLKTTIKGFLPSLFDFGDLRIQTASEKGEFILDQIGEAELTKQIIFEAKMDYQKQKYGESY
jgi:hypothetical protein